MLVKRYSIVLISILIFGSLQAQTADTTMTIDFQVTTSSPGGNYSPRNIGAIWIEADDGSFVKTLRVWANNRRQHLYTWNNRTGGNTVDGITGSTYSSHGTRTASWDFTNANGDTVAPGTYTLRLELTDQHSQGPLYAFSFPFMGATETITPPDQSNFHNMELVYDLTIVVGLDGISRLIPNKVTLDQNYPNPFNPTTTISFSLPQTAYLKLSVFDFNGHLVQTVAADLFGAGQHEVTWNGRNSRGEAVESGLYICRLDSKGATYTSKMLLLK